jgi:hypothetical protein
MHRPLLILLSLSACAPFPEVVTNAQDAGPPPPLLPIDQLLAQADLSPPVLADPLQARAAALKARAARLRAAPTP